MALDIADLVAVTSVDVDDIFHLRKVTNLDRKITAANLYTDIENAISLSLLATLKGFMQIDLTNWATGTIPEIVANSVVEINGSLYTNPSAVAITGATVNSTWYDILLTPSGTTFTASFIARMTGTWDAAKQGLYSGNNRVVACVYRDGSANFINKNILEVKNRKVKIQMELGDWNMDASSTHQIPHGLGADFIKVRNAQGIIFEDGSTAVWNFIAWQAGQTLEHYIALNSTNIAFIRANSGQFDKVAFDATSFNRGLAILEYEV